MVSPIAPAASLLSRSVLWRVSDDCLRGVRVDSRIESKFVPDPMRPHMATRGAQHHPTVKLLNPSNETIPMAMCSPGVQNEARPSCLSRSPEANT